MTAVVLDLSANGIGIIRSLGRKGIKVYAFDTFKKYKLGKTRYATCKPCPDPTTEEEKLLSVLINLSNTLKTNPILYAGSDDFVFFISKHRSLLAEHYHFLMPDHQTIEDVLNKQRTAILTELHQIPSPKTYIVDQLSTLPTITFPCILKPVHGHEFRKKMNKKAIVIHNEIELHEQFAFYNHFGELLIQEIIPGTEKNIYQVGTLFDEHMSLRGVFMGQKLNQFPPYFGAGALVQSVHDKEVLEMGISVLKKLQFKGLSVVEFKRDARDGQLKFIEINARTWLWHSLSGRCGVDLTHLYYLLLTNQNPKPILTQQEGIKWIYFIRHFLSFKEKKKHTDLTWKQWFHTLKGKKEDSLFCLDDPMPFFRITWSHLTYTWRNRKQEDNT